MSTQWTHHSNAIEGSSLTEQETEAVVRGYSLSGNCFKEMKEVKNHLKAIKYIESLVRDKGMLTSAEIIETQALVLKETEEDMLAQGVKETAERRMRRLVREGRASGMSVSLSTVYITLISLIPKPNA